MDALDIAAGRFRQQTSPVVALVSSCLTRAVLAGRIGPVMIRRDQIVILAALLFIIQEKVASCLLNGKHH